MNDTTTTLKTFTASIQVDAQTIADQITTAIEGGSGYWLTAFKPTAETKALAKEQPWYACPHVWSGNFEVECQIDGEEKKTFKPENIQAGLEYLATRYPNRIAEIVNEGGDAETADVFIQACLFKEIVYG